MAKVTYRGPIGEISGSIDSKDKTILSRTKHHNSGEKVVKGQNELFRRRKRDYEKTPATENEQKQINKFAEACAYMRTWWNKDVSIMAQSPDYQYWHKRWQKQIEKAEPTAPLDKHGHRKIYVDFRAFVRAKYMAGERVGD